MSFKNFNLLVPRKGSCPGHLCSRPLLTSHAFLCICHSCTSVVGPVAQDQQPGAVVPKPPRQGLAVFLLDSSVGFSWSPGQGCQPKSVNRIWVKNVLVMSCSNTSLNTKFHISGSILVLKNLSSTAWNCPVHRVLFSWLDIALKGLERLKETRVHFTGDVNPIGLIGNIPTLNFMCYWVFHEPKGHDYRDVHLVVLGNDSQHSCRSCEETKLRPAFTNETITLGLVPLGVHDVFSSFLLAAELSLHFSYPAVSDLLLLWVVLCLFFPDPCLW